MIAKYVATLVTKTCGDFTFLIMSDCVDVHDTLPIITCIREPGTITTNLFNQSYLQNGLRTIKHDIATLNSSSSFGCMPMHFRSN